MSWFSLSKEKAQRLLLKGVLENNVKKIDKALKAGADINYSYSAEELLQEMDAINCPDNKGATVMYTAVHDNREDIALALLERGANPLQMVGEGEMSPIYFAAWNNMNTFINAVAARGYPLNDLSVTIWNPLFAAAHNNNIKATQALIAAGMDINCYDRVNGTPLFYKLDSNNLSPDAKKYVEMALDAGADLYPIAPDRRSFFNSISPSWHPTLLDSYLDKLRKNLTCEPSAGIDPQRLLQDGKPTTELLHYCGAHMLPELFTEQRWKGKEGEALALFEQVKTAIADYYKPALEAIDLTPLRRGVTQKDTGPAVARFVRNRSLPEAQR